MILHVDMDAYYASVEERDHPELRGRPLVVGGSSSQRGVVAAANYAARTFGVHSAMPMATAMRLCPSLVVLPVRMTHYAAIAREIREIFLRYTPLIEPLSLDEAFLDVTGSERLFGSPATIGRAIKNVIGDELNLVASVGVAANKFLAKIASDLDKPDGVRSKYWNEPQLDISARVTKLAELPSRPNPASANFLQSNQTSNDHTDGIANPVCRHRIWLSSRRSYEMLKSCGTHSTQLAHSCNSCFNPGNCTFSFSLAGSIGNNKM